MISEWVATAVTEHICSKMRQLSTSMKISRNCVCLSSKIAVIILRNGTVESRLSLSVIRF